MSYGSELPPPGWYPDPENLSGPKRWWDGSDWTDRRRMDGPQPPAPGQYPAPAYAGSTQAGGYERADQFPSLDRTMTFGGRSFGANWLPLALVELATRVVPGVAFQWALMNSLDGFTVHTDGTLTAPPNPAWGALGGTFAASLVLGLLGFAIGVSIVMHYLDIRGENGSASNGLYIGPAIAHALRRLVPLAGWYLLTVGVVWAAFIALGLLTIALPPLGVIAILAAIPAGLYLTVRFVFTGVAAVDRPGNPFSRSARVSADRFWQVFATLLVAGLAIFLVNLIVSFVVGLFQPPLFEPVELSDGVQIVANPSTLGFVLQGFFALVIGTFLSGFGGGVGVLLYRAANPRSGDPGATATSSVY